MTELAENAVWRPAKPALVREWMAKLPVPWWIAGGWAVDLFLAHVTRPHGDIDVGIFRSDAPTVRSNLADWEFFEAHAGALTWLAPDTAPRREVNSLWCRRSGGDEWMMELLLDDGSGDQWIFRRNREIWRPLELAICRSADGIPFLSPEIQLLFKSKHARPIDQLDFENVLKCLGNDARAWLRSSLRTIAPSHTWLSKL